MWRAWQALYKALGGPCRRLGRRRKYTLFDGESDVQAKRKQFRSPGAKNDEKLPPKIYVSIRFVSFLVFEVVMVCDQIFGQGFDQGLGEGEKP